MLAGMNLIGQARARGYELEEKPLEGRSVWGWRRGDDDRHPCFPLPTYGRPIRQPTTRFRRLPRRAFGLRKGADLV
jgi:hypothetical protein